MSAEEKKSTYELNEQQRKNVVPLIRTIGNQLDRHKNVRDPIARNMLLVDNLCAIVDLMCAIADTIPQEAGFDRDTCKEIKEVSDRIKQAIMELFDWIQNPTYTTEHPVGQEMMRQGQKRLEDTERKVRALD